MAGEEVVDRAIVGQAIAAAVPGVSGSRRVHEEGQARREVGHVERLHVNLSPRSETVSGQGLCACDASCRNR